MDAQDMDIHIDDDDEIIKGHVFVEGDSDVIDEEAEHNLSLGDHTMRKTLKKGPKSLDDFEGEEEDNQEE